MATHEEEPVHPPIIEVDPGDSVQIIDGIFIEVETNGTVRVTDGIFVQKFSTGGQPITISVKTPNSDFIRVVVVCDDKICA